MPHPSRRTLTFVVILAVTAFIGLGVEAQNHAPNPYDTVEGIWGKLPAGRTWGSSSAVQSATDGSGNLWLFGGTGLDAAGTSGTLNDLWRFDGTNWAWVSGSHTVVSQQGVYGTRGVASDSNIPGGLFAGASWIDAHGTIWLFGGHGTDAAGNSGLLNTLWRGSPGN